MLLCSVSQKQQSRQGQGRAGGEEGSRVQGEGGWHKGGGGGATANRHLGDLSLAVATQAVVQAPVPEPACLGAEQMIGAGLGGIHLHTCHKSAREPTHVYCELHAMSHQNIELLS